MIYLSSYAVTFYHDIYIFKAKLHFATYTGITKFINCDYNHIQVLEVIYLTSFQFKCLDNSSNCKSELMTIFHR